jgi:NADH-quinone oxidoreductase subunit L
MFAALAVGGRTQAVGHLLSHAAFKALLFLCAGAVIHVVGSNLMADMGGGLARGLPVTFATMTIGFAALAGVPPTSGFFTKDAIVSAAMESHAATAGLVTVGVLATALVTAAYATRAWLRTFFGPRAVSPDGASPPVHEAPWIMLGPLVVLAVPALLLGFPLQRLPELRPELGPAVLSVALAAVGALVAYAAWRRDPAHEPANALGRLRPVFATAFGTDDLYERTVAVAVMRLARAVVGVDDQVVGRAVTGTGRSARRLGGLLRLTQNGNPQFYVTGVLAGALLIAVGVAVLS